MQKNMFAKILATAVFSALALSGCNDGDSNSSGSSNTPSQSDSKVRRPRSVDNHNNRENQVEANSRNTNAEQQNRSDNVNASNNRNGNPQNNGNNGQQPAPKPTQENPDMQMMLKAINDARATPRNCGSEHFDAGPPLVWDTKLAAAAKGHAIDMAEQDYFDHKGKDGREPKHRVEAQFYDWSYVSENIAAGSTAYRTLDQVMKGWLDSPGHCENLMDPRAKEVGMAYIVKNRSTYGKYWVQNFAAPQ